MSKTDVLKPCLELEIANRIVGALATQAGMLFSERNAMIAARAAISALSNDAGRIAGLREAAAWIERSVANSGKLLAAAMLDELGVTDKVGELLAALTPKDTKDGEDVR